MSVRDTVSMFHDVDIFAVPCPYCHARANEPCRTGKGRGEQTLAPHLYRARRAIAHEKERIWST